MMHLPSCHQRYWRTSYNKKMLENTFNTFPFYLVIFSNKLYFSDYLNDFNLEYVIRLTKKNCNPFVIPLNKAGFSVQMFDNDE